MAQKNVRNSTQAQEAEEESKQEKTAETSLFSTNKHTKEPEQAKLAKESLSRVTPVIRIGLDDHRQSMDKLAQVQNPYIMSMPSTSESAKNKAKFPNSQANKNIKNVFSNQISQNKSPTQETKITSTKAKDAITHRGNRRHTTTASDRHLQIEKFRKVRAENKENPNKKKEELRQSSVNAREKTLKTQVIEKALGPSDAVNKSP